MKSASPEPGVQHVLPTSTMLYVRAGQENRSPATRKLPQT